jgi:hypothetical protein
VAVAEAPTVQRLPVRPNRPLVLALGLFLAFFISIAVVFAAELVRDTVHTPRELELVAGVPVIATIPVETNLPAERNKFTAADDEFAGEEALDLKPVREWHRRAAR